MGPNAVHTSSGIGGKYGAGATDVSGRAEVSGEIVGLEFGAISDVEWMRSDERRSSACADEPAPIKPSMKVNEISARRYPRNMSVFGIRSRCATIVLFVGEEPTGTSHTRPRPLRQ
jgi:hypothetical protein